jgi:hypothetical protein
VRPLAQRCSGPRGGDGGVRRGLTTEFTQHEVGCCNPHGGGCACGMRVVLPVSMMEGGGGLWCALPMWCALALGSWQGQRLVVAVLVVCHHRGRCSAMCWSSVGGVWPPSAPSESFAWLWP